MSRMHRQQGAALIVVLMMFSIIYVIAIEIMYRQDRFRARTQSLMSWDTRYQYALAAEAVAIRALTDDLDQDNAEGNLVDDCVAESWAINLPPTPYEDAMITASVQDLQGRFNLNWLVIREGDAFVRSEVWRERLATMLGTTLINSGKAQTLSHEMADWIDSNNLVDELEGAEDAEYRFRRTPNLPAAHESELRALLSAEASDFPDDGNFWGLFTALPLETRININTAPIPVLDAILSDTVGPEGTQAIKELREEDAISNLDTLMEKLPFSELEEQQIQEMSALLGIKSEYFQVMIDIQHDGRTSRLISRIQRPERGPAKVFSRQVVPRVRPLEPACNPLYNDEQL